MEGCEFNTKIIIMKTDLIQKAIVRSGFSNAKVTELHQLDLLQVMYNLIDITKEQSSIFGVVQPEADKVCEHCEEAKGFYLGMTCKHCNKPFRQPSKL